MEEIVWDWPKILWVTLIGFSLVFVLLVALIYIMKGFSAFFVTRSKASASGKPAVAPQPMISPEEIAAIVTALKSYKSVLHDRESEVVTILNIKRAYSPWNSKIYGLTQQLNRK